MNSLFEDQKAALKDCVDRFEKLGIAYMLTGSMAMVNYAMMRMTNDIDIVMELNSGDATKIIAEFEPDYYVPHDRVRDAIDRRSMFNLLHQKTIVKIDCVVRKTGKFDQAAFDNRKKLDYFGFDVWVIGKEDLVLSKLRWAKDSRSEMQMRDVAGIIRNGYDEEYVQGWAKKLDVEDILNDCISLLGEKNVERHDA